MADFNSIADVMTWLDAIPKFQMQGAQAMSPDLKNITACCRELENPHLKYPVIHVGGTNGKGTTCYMLEHIYRSAGHRTGLFTSPHLLRYNERVRIDKEEISDAEIIAFFRKYEPLLRKHRLTYFEIAAVLAFYTFAARQVEIAIVEVGLGGRADSTNIVQPLASVITGIGLDHREILGETEPEIAREKGGIIKKNMPVIIGNVSDESLQVLEEIAARQNAPVHRARDYTPELLKGTFTARNPEIRFQIPLIERVNRWNIMAVLLTVQNIQQAFPLQQAEAIAALGEFAGAPARFEKLDAARDWYFCGAHNPQALESVIQSLNHFKGRKPVLIFSMLKDKVSEESVKLLCNFEQRYFFQQSGERAAPFAYISSIMEVKPITEENHHTILTALETELVIIAGSFYFYPVVKRWLSKI